MPSAGLYSVVTADYFGVQKLASAIGVVMTSWTVGAFIGAPVSGWLYDGTGEYTLSWVICGGAMVCGGLATGLGVPMVDGMYPDRLYKVRRDKSQAA